MANIHTKRIYLIRHGQTDYNNQGIVQGRGVDTSLNAMGRMQAKAFYEHYQQVPFAKVYVSTLKRTYESVASFIEELSIPYESLSGLDEISWGYKEGKKIGGPGEELYSRVVESWNRGDTHITVPGGESPNEVAERQKKAMDHILSQPGEENILICMHGRAMRILLAWLIDHDLAKMDNYGHKNLCLYILEYSEGRVRIVTNNEQSHLEKITQHQ